MTRDTVEAVRLDREIMSDWSGRAERTTLSNYPPGAGQVPTGTELNATNLAIYGLSTYGGGDVYGA